jgi:hypothetical protein
MMNRRSKLQLLILLAGITFSGCDRYKYDEGWFPGTPLNLELVNSEYDDYNSALPPDFEGIIPLLFSSNRNSQGGNYDIVKEFIFYQFDRNDGKLSISKYGYPDLMFEPLVNVPGIINTSGNEFGPYIAEFYPEYYDKWNGQYLIMYASDAGGNLDIKFINNFSTDSINLFEEPFDISFLNSSADDVYPCLTDDFNQIYFCSDREGNFDIYRADIDGTDIIEALSDTSAKLINKVTALNSEGNDKCPYIKGKTMVFTSDRPAGFGGFDLYYSIMDQDGNWSSPVNFGEKINSAYDDYRPIIMKDIHFKNDLMIFSSNRPGGRGGFDLYYVGVTKR